MAGRRLGAGPSSWASPLRQGWLALLLARGVGRGEPARGCGRSVCAGLAGGGRLLVVGQAITGDPAAGHLLPCWWGPRAVLAALVVIGADRLLLAAVACCWWWARPSPVALLQAGGGGCSGNPPAAGQAGAGRWWRSQARGRPPRPAGQTPAARFCGTRAPLLRPPQNRADHRQQRTSGLTVLTTVSLLWLCWRQPSDGPARRRVTTTTENTDGHHHPHRRGVRPLPPDG